MAVPDFKFLQIKGAKCNKIIFQNRPYIYINFLCLHLVDLHIFSIPDRCFRHQWSFQLCLNDSYFATVRAYPEKIIKYVDSGAPLSCPDKFVGYIFKELKTSQSFKILEGRRKGKGEGMEIEGLMLFFYKKCNYPKVPKYWDTQK